MIGSIVFNCDKTGLGNKEQEIRNKEQGTVCFVVIVETNKI